MRRLNSRFSVDGDELIKTSNGQMVPHDEPLFVLRGRDKLAIDALYAYRELAIKDGCNAEFLLELRATMDEFEAYCDSHPIKQPGVTRGK